MRHLDGVISSDSQKIKEKDLPFDKGHLFYLWKLFHKCLYNDVPVSFVYDHDNILYDIADKTDLEIINIDHHHDVLYSNDMIQHTIKMRTFLQ